MSKENHWSNIKDKEIFIDSMFPLNTIYFLYEFLGDGFDIKSESFHKNLDKWKNLNKKWKIKILRDKTDSLDLFVYNNFPNFYQMYINYDKDIQRCDIFRYMLMYQHGGIYSDLDVIPKYPIDNIIYNISTEGVDLSWANIIFGIARIKDKKKCINAQKYESIRKGEIEIPIKLSNYFFISRVKRHPIWLDILRLAKERSKNKIKSQYGIIYSTGPDLVTTAVSKNRQKYKDIAIIPLKLFKSIFTHQCSSSWRASDLKKCETGIDTT